MTWWSARRLLIPFCAVNALAFGASCESRECAQMRACCEVAQEDSAVGASCGELARGVRDPDKCRTILETVRLVFADRPQDLPGECK